MGKFYIRKLYSRPLGTAPQAAGFVIEKVGVEAKQPNSAIRKAVRVQMKRYGKKILAYVPEDGGLNFVDENDDVMVSGFGRSGRAMGDMPGIRFKIVKVGNVGLSSLCKHK